MPNLEHKRKEIEAILREAEHRNAPAAAAVRSDDATLRQPAPMAIVGLAGRYPGADNIDAFWEISSRDVTASRNYVARGRKITPIADEHDARAVIHQCGYFGLLDEVYRFDAPFFNISRREARSWITTCDCCWRQSGRARRERRVSAPGNRQTDRGVHLVLQSRMRESPGRTRGGTFEQAVSCHGNDYFHLRQPNFISAWSERAERGL